MSARSERLLLSVGLPVATLVLIVGPLLLAWDDLPPRLAVGWDQHGVPDTSASPAGFLTLLTVFGLVTATLFVVAGARRWKIPLYNGLAAVIAAAIAPTLVVVSISTVAANRGATDWTTVGGPSWGWIVAAVVGPLIGIGLVGWLVRDMFRTITPPLDEQPSAGLSLADTTTAAWHSGASSRWPFLVAGPLVGLGIASGAAALSGFGDSTQVDRIAWLLTGLGLLGIAAIVMAFATILVSVDRRGLTIRYGILPRPRTRVGLDEIETAHAVDVKPTEHGGWGYRGSRRIFGKAAVVIRGGEGIRLGLKDGNEFIVTVDDAARGAGVLNDLRATIR
ncbi:MAG: hypothetical protein ACR2QK_20580 [Acidimicrobiales bacterium]